MFSAKQVILITTFSLVQFRCNFLTKFIQCMKLFEQSTLYFILFYFIRPFTSAIYLLLRSTSRGIMFLIMLIRNYYARYNKTKHWNSRKQGNNRKSKYLVKIQYHRYFYNKRFNRKFDFCPMIMFYVDIGTGKIYCPEKVFLKLICS